MGVIFCIDTFSQIKEREGEVFMPQCKPYEMKNFIPGATCVLEEDNFEEHCRRFSEHYNTKGKFVDFADSIGIKWRFFELEIGPILTILEDKRQKIIQFIRQEIQKDEPDLFAISRSTWNSEFWFMWDVTVEPEMGFLRYLEHLKSFLGTKKILLTESFEYL